MKWCDDDDNGRMDSDFVSSLNPPLLVLKWHSDIDDTENVEQSLIIMRHHVQESWRKKSI